MAEYLKAIISTRVVAAALAIALTSCAIAQPRQPALNVQIKRSGLLAPGGPTVETVYWTDNTHVLFVGARKGLHHNLPDGRKPLMKFLFRWNIETGEVETLAELPGDFQRLCYHRGYVRYMYGIQKRWVIKAGPLGEEKDVAEEEERTSKLGVRVNAVTCRPYNQRELDAKGLKGFWPLREEHGYWGQFPGNPDGGPVLIRFDGDRRVELKVSIPYLRNPKWSDYFGAYVFSWSNSLRGIPNPGGKMWTVFPDGKATSVDIPPGPWLGGATGYAPMRAGTFLYSYAMSRDGNGNAGAYLVREGTAQRFVEGLIYAFGISPDGCKVAISVREHDGHRETAEMVAASLCS